MDSDEKNKLLRRILTYFFSFVFIMGLVVWFSRSGPRHVDTDISWRDEVFSENVDDKDLAGLFEESVSLEQAFQRAREKGGPLSAEQALLLEEAIRLQRTYIERLGRVDIDAIARQKRLEARLQNEQADILLQESLALESTGRSALSDQDKDIAINALYQAAYLQKKINEEYPLSAAADYGRPVRLSRIIQDLEAEPLSVESYTAERAARQALQAANKDEAIALLRTAIVLQERINTDYKNTRHVDFARLNGLLRDIQTMEAEATHAHFLKVVEAALSSENKGDYKQAAEAYASARTLQEQLNQDYPKSRYASSAQIANLRHAEQLALSQTSFQSLQEQLAKIDASLAKNDVSTAEGLINELKQMWTQFQEDYSSIVQEKVALAERVEYLLSHKEALKALLDEVYSSLLTTPSFPDKKLFNAEVPQGLFKAVMGTNPSRHLGDTLPVDSVSWEEAQLFCKYLSWCVGRPVMLPDESLFRDVLGHVDGASIQSESWNASNSGIKTHPIRTKVPNAQGAYDMLGNVSEWLDAEASLEKAPIIGGSMEDLPQTLEQVPQSSLSKRERSRTLGFRFFIYVLEG